MSNTYHPRGKLIDGLPPGEHRLYSVWAHMKTRCDNPEFPQYHDYGGRGIKYCDRWKHFENFYNDMKEGQFPKCTIERINNNGNYEPNNCKWGTRSEQSLNRRIFVNNTSGFTGIHQTDDGRWNARYQVELERYNLGKFTTAYEAFEARELFISLLSDDKECAMKMIERRARYDSQTQIKGITKSPCGFIVRKTINGKRVYLGHTTSLKEAKRLLGV